MQLAISEVINRETQRNKKRLHRERAIRRLRRELKAITKGTVMNIPAKLTEQELNELRGQIGIMHHAAAIRATARLRHVEARLEEAEKLLGMSMTMIERRGCHETAQLIRIFLASDVPTAETK